MPRSLRIEFPGAWYHVMNRGLGRRSIFASNKDRETFLNSIHSLKPGGSEVMRTKSRQRFVARLEREKQLRSMTAQVKNNILSAVMT